MNFYETRPVIIEGHQRLAFCS